MSWIDWCVFIIPFLGVCYMALKCRKYSRSVADFLAAGRVCGRYVLTVAGQASGLSVVSFVSYAEIHYKTGFLVGFWQSVFVPLTIILSMSGFCVYRFRRTKVLSMGQFLEMRYNRALRVIGSIIKTIAEMMTNVICPAVAARFFIYFLGLPAYVQVCGVEIQTFSIVMGGALLLALFFILNGGTIALIVTDTLQMLISYPIFLLFTVFVFCNFSWFDEIQPVLADRIAGESFINPFDVKGMRDFNLFAILVAIIAKVLNRGSWMGGGTSAAGRTAHEQKMAGVLSTFRGGFYSVCVLLFAAVMILFLNHEKFSGEARLVRTTTVSAVADELIRDPKLQKEIVASAAAIPAQKHRIGVDTPLSQTQNLETVYLNTVHDKLGRDSKGNALFQQFRTLYQQGLLSQVMRHILPTGMLGLLALLMIMLMVSTDDSRMFNSAVSIMQDIILPHLKRTLTPEQHLRWLKCCTVGVAIFFFIAGRYMAQVDYIQLYCEIASSIWLCGAGPIVVFGLYSRFGNTVGAFSSLIVGTGFGVGGNLLQRNWAGSVYPWLESMGWVPRLDSFLQAVSGPFQPYILWKMNPVKFPINSIEIYFLGMMCGVIAYCLGSWIVGRKPYNLDRMLRRGKYCDDGRQPPKIDWSPRHIFSTLIGINSDYSKGDRIIAWSVFLWTFVKSFCLGFVVVAVWNVISPWPITWWSWYFFLNFMVLPAFVGIIITVWYMIGGIRDLRQMFIDLDKRIATVEDASDNGVVQKEKE